MSEAKFYELEGYAEKVFTLELTGAQLNMIRKGLGNIGSGDPVFRELEGLKLVVALSDVVDAAVEVK